MSCRSATIRNFHDVIMYLCDKGADANITDTNGMSVILLLCQRLDSDVIRYLVSRGASVNIFNHRVPPPLHVYFDRGDLEMFEFLLDNGADIDIGNVEVYRQACSNFQLLITFRNRDTVS